MRYPGFSNARLAGDNNDLARAGLCALPAPMQELELLLPADKRGKRCSPERLEPARPSALAERLIDAYAICERYLRSLSACGLPCLER
jgi:hypothetical protein